MTEYIKKKLIKHKRVIRFLIVGGISTCIDFLIYYSLNRFIDISISKLISMICACSFSFVLNRTWTFSFKGKRILIQILKYIFVQMINISVNVSINYFTFKFTGIKLLAFVFATAVAMVVNYLLQKIFVFKEKQ